MTEIQWMQIGIAIIQVVGIPILLWIAKILKRMYGEMRRDNKLNALKMDALVIVLDNRLNGNFKSEYLREVENRKSDFNFVYKEK